jgi:polysaccharide pyruvyl transferase WcaK-like protein
VRVVPSQPGEWGAAGETVAADCRLPIGDLPRLVPDLVPRPGWLRADPVRRARWRERLEQLGPGPRVGIAWRGGATARTRAARSVPLAEFAALCAAGAARFVSLQYGEVTADLAAAPRRLRERLTVFADLDPLRDLEDLFALMSELDLVITVDNSTVHVAGALGVPAWLLLPALADWRWPTDGTGSRWYASVRLHRPASGGSRGWREPLQRLAGELAGLPSRPPAGPGPALAPLPPPPLLPATPAGARALLLNDTSRWYHWGCACTSLALRDGLTARGRRVQGVPIDALGQLQPLPTSRDALADEHLFAAFRVANAGLCRALETADEVWINGEGSLHGASPLAIGLLYLAWLAATRFGKPVRIVNHSCYPGTGPVQAYYQAVYERLAGVAVREPVSAALLRQQGLAVTETFDCLPLFATAVADDIRREPGTDVLIAGSVAHDAGMVAACAALATTLRQRGLRPRLLVGAPANLAADDRSFGRALHAATAGGIEILLARSELEWLSAIASARLLVSGRFHYSIAAAWLGTPFLALDSNTPKMAGLMQALGLAMPPERGAGNLAVLLEQRAEQLLAAGDAGLLAAGKRADLLAAARRNFD